MASQVSTNGSAWKCAAEGTFVNCTTTSAGFGQDAEPLLAAAAVDSGGPPSMAAPGGPPGPPPFGPPPLPPDAYVDARVFFIIEMVINAGLINLLAVLGSTGNALNIFILFKHGVKTSSINVVLVSMAVADFLVLVTLPLRKVSLLVGLFDKVLAKTVESHVIGYNFLAFNRTWALISHSHVVIIAFERFLAITFPFKVSKWITPFKMTVACALTHVLWYALLWPMYTTFSLRWVKLPPPSNATVAVAWISDFYLRHEKAFNFYISYVVNLLNVAFQLAAVLVCSVAIIAKLVVMGRKRREMRAGGDMNAVRGLREKTMPEKSRITVSTIASPSSDGTNNFQSPIDREESSDGQEKGTRKEEGVSGKATRHTPDSSRDESVTKTTTAAAAAPDQVSTSQPAGQQSVGTQPGRFSRSAGVVDLKVLRMLLVVCVVYVLLILPTFLLFVFQQVFQELREPRWVRVNFIATSVSMLLLATNSSVNFIIYVYMSQKFRKSFHEFCRCSCRK